ncbi:MAG TPA: hypothetical protein VF466_00035 [Candidatus Saccharimonadales bacterium]
MPTATPERFNPRADYLDTLSSFALAFSGVEVFDAGKGARILVGDLAVTRSLATIEGADTIRLTVVEMTQGEDVSYRYSAQHRLEDGGSWGAPTHGMYFSNFGDPQLARTDEHTNKRVRSWLDAARFDRLEAMFAAHDQIPASVTDAANAEQAAEKRAQQVRRDAQRGRRLGWLSLRRRNRDTQPPDGA